MTVNVLHDWNLTPEEAIHVQQQLAGRVEREDRLGEVKLVAGVDMAINEQTNMAHAAVVLLTYPALVLVEQHIHEEVIPMPYIPGLLSFREAPSVLGAFRKLKQQPDLVMVDGAGIAHPRAIGIASHLGLWLDLPTIGCAKSMLLGQFDSAALAQEAGAWVPIIQAHKVIGAAVRTRTKVKPMIISLGHRISLESSIAYVLACAKGYRLPEPTRQADKLSKDNEWREPETELTLL